MRRVTSANLFKTVQQRRCFLPATAIKTSCRALAMSITTKTSLFCAIAIAVIVGLLCGVVCAKHFRDVRLGHDYLFHYLRAAQVAIAYKPASFRRCYGIQFWEHPRNQNTQHLRLMRFTLICTANGIEHCLTKSKHSSRKRQLERMKRTIWKATSKRSYQD